eukprot:11248238-Alexandrium_andersonii.AAC.1
MEPQAPEHGLNHATTLIGDMVAQMVVQMVARALVLWLPARCSKRDVPSRWGPLLAALRRRPCSA